MCKLFYSSEGNQYVALQLVCEILWVKRENPKKILETSHSIDKYSKKKHSAVCITTECYFVDINVYSFTVPLRSQPPGLSDPVQHRTSRADPLAET